MVEMVLHNVIVPEEGELSISPWGCGMISQELVKDLGWKLRAGYR
jgi:hypothetical protein